MAPPRQAAPVATAAPVQAPPPPITEGDLRSRLYSALMEAKQAHLADAVEHSQIEESGADLVFTTQKMYQMYLKSAELDAAVRRVHGKPARIVIKIAEASAAPSAPVVQPATQKSETSDRALAHPEVQKFQELFPGSQVRAVRNLKEGDA
jgi:hypothetical protein